LTTLARHGMTKPPASSRAEWKARRFVGLDHRLRGGIPSSGNLSVEELLEQAQEHIRPLIGLIDRLNEANAEDELRVINRQLARLCFRVQPLPSD
jgi:hypothetical protein